MAIMKPKGSASVPFNKRKVAVFGSGGYTGATIFGFIQRASALYGTGLGPPRSICATPSGSEGLNKVLGRTFKFAFAGEDMIRLTNMLDVDAISRSLNGMDAAILGTIYQQERKSIALNTYEKTPNDKTFEFYLDDRYASDWDISSDDTDFHLGMFKRSISACKEAGLEHIVVIETPATKDSKPFTNILREACIPFTYISTNAKIETTKVYSFEEGLQSSLDIDLLPVSSKRSMDIDASIPGGTGENNVIAREDLAALAVQSILSLDWKESRCLNIIGRGDTIEKLTGKQKSKLKSDRDWCMKSEVLAQKLIKL
jgi:hypothetical protein